MTLPLSGKCALITGSSHGVGYAAAHLFASQGASVVLHANTNLDRAIVAARTIGDRALGVVAADLAQPGAGTRLFAEADHLAQGKLDVLINNAGIYLANPLGADEETWNSAWDRVLQVNLRAVADLCRAAVAVFAKRGGGAIVNIASRAGYRGDDGDHSAYAASKGAVLALTKTLARAYGKDGLLCYALAPGWINTRMAPDNAAGLAAARSEIPIGRMAEPEEVAAMCAFLASGACASATGACIDINGASYVR
ncbi:MAG TPA: SDR family oxidoreductase [Xanthomonadaceae bacterium]|nr:SDR family oxidoreductase [Xanthomonadaceae bacterium]